MQGLKGGVGAGGARAFKFGSKAGSMGMNAAKKGVDGARTTVNTIDAYTPDAMKRSTKRLFTSVFTTALGCGMCVVTLTIFLTAFLPLKFIHDTSALGILTVEGTYNYKWRGEYKDGTAYEFSGVSHDTNIQRQYGLLGSTYIGTARVVVAWADIWTWFGDFSSKGKDFHCDLVNNGSTMEKINNALDCVFFTAQKAAYDDLNTKTELEMKTGFRDLYNSVGNKVFFGDHVPRGSTFYVDDVTEDVQFDVDADEFILSWSDPEDELCADMWFFSINLSFVTFFFGSLSFFYNLCRFWPWWDVAGRGGVQAKATVLAMMVACWALSIVVLFDMTCGKAQFSKETHEQGMETYTMGPGKLQMLVAGIATALTCFLHVNLDGSMPPYEREIVDEGHVVPQFAGSAVEEADEEAMMAAEEMMNENDEEHDPDQVSYLRTRKQNASTTASDSE